MEVVSKKNKEFQLFIDEKNAKFIGNYAVVEAHAIPREQLDLKKRPSSFFIKGVIDSNYNEALFGFDRGIGDIIRYGSRDFIVYKKANYIDGNNQNKFQHFRVTNMGLQLVNEIIATEMKRTVINGIMQGINFLYDLKEGKIIFNKGAFIKTFKIVNMGYEAEVVDYIFTENASYEIKFSINEKGEIIGYIYCEYLNRCYSKSADYNQIKSEIKKHLFDEETKRKKTQEQIAKIKKLNYKGNKSNF
jgi:hypothetical protein